MKITLSTNGYSHKPTKDEMSKAHFSTYDCNSLMQLLEEKITKGYMYAGHYDFQTTYFQFINKNEGEHIKKDHYVGTHLVSIDIDHSEVCLDDFHETLRVKPSFAYESLSNREGNYCYRLVYAFEEEILGKQNYDYVLHSILDFLNIKTDKRAKDAYHIFYGTTPLAHTYCSNKLFELSDFNCSLVKVQMAKYNYSVYNNIVNNKTQYTANCTFNERLVMKMQELDYENVYKSLYKRFRFIDSSQRVLEADEDIPMIPIPGDYYEIRNHYIKKNGKKYIRKKKDGEHRKSYLFNNCCIRRLAVPEISPDDLLYSLCYDMTYRIDNSKDPITPEILMGIVIDSLNKDLTTFQYIRPRENMVNPAYCAKYGMTKEEVAHKFASKKGHSSQSKIKQNKKQLFLSLYNSNLTIKSNIEEIQAKTGQVFKERTVKLWLKEEGLTRPYKKRSVSPDNDKGGTTDQEETEKPSEGLKKAENKIISIKLSKPYPRITDDEGYWMVNEGYAIAY